jgi:hypothetical protein
VKGPLPVLLLGCAAIVLGALVVARNPPGLDDELLGGGIIAAGLAIILAALPGR